MMSARDLPATRPTRRRLRLYRGPLFYPSFTHPGGVGDHNLTLYGLPLISMPQKQYLLRMIGRLPLSAAKRPPQHNDSVATAGKRADQGAVEMNKASAPHNPHIGRGNDERGRYGRGATTSESKSAQPQEPGAKP